MTAKCTICKRADDSGPQREKKLNAREAPRERKVRGNLLRAGDKRCEREEGENGRGIINGYYENSGVKWKILIV